MEGGKMTTLSNEEKMAVVNQHLKSVEYSIYGLSLDLIEAQAATSPDAEQVSAINAKIADATARKTALVTEKSSLTITE
jgi:hypothetical protein